MFVAAIVGRVVRVHEGDPNALEMKEYTIARHAKVTVNGKKVGLADLENGDQVEFRNGSKDGFQLVTAVRTKDAAKGAVATKPDLSKPQTVRAVVPDPVSGDPAVVSSTTPVVPLPSTPTKSASTKTAPTTPAPSSGSKK